MKVLLAEDDPVSRCMLEAALFGWGYEVVAVEDGGRAWELLQGPDAPRLAILDWVMPGLSGIEVCRRLRRHPETQATYALLLTARDAPEDVVAGLESGASDYLTKPFNRQELHARLRVGRRLVELQQSLADRVGQLEAALAQVRVLQGLLPICCYCKKIRDDGNYWLQVEQYLAEHGGVRFTHGICPDCVRSHVEPQLRDLALRRQADLAESPPAES
jgi:DNA-binding response OmpR family regulator